MSDFLDINGVPISVADSTATAPAPEDIGDEQRAVDGSLVRSRIALKQKYAWTTAPLIATDALAWKALINGYGHHWSFDTSTFSGKGLGAIAASGSSGQIYTQTGAGGKYAGMLQVDTNAAGGSFQVNPSGLDSISPFGWTVMFWARAQDGVTWNHYILIGSGNIISSIYKNGVLIGPDSVTGCVAPIGAVGLSEVEFFGYGFEQNGATVIPNWLATHTYAANAYVQPTVPHLNGRYYQVTAGGGGNSGGSEPTWPTVLGNTVVDGAITWTDRGPSSLYIDDLVILPFQAPISWVTPLYTFCAAQAYPDQPKLQVSGLYPLQANLMMGAVGETKLIQGFLAGAFTQNLQTVEFSLQEA